MTVNLQPISYSAFRREVPRKTKFADLICHFCLQTLKNQDLLGHQGRGWTRHVAHKKCLQAYIHFQFTQRIISIKCDFCVLPIQNALDHLPPPPWTEKIRQFFIRHETLGGTVVAGIPTLGNRLIAEVVLRLNISEDDLTGALITSAVSCIFTGICTAKLLTWLQSAVAKKDSFFLTGFFPTLLVPHTYSYLPLLWREKLNAYLGLTYGAGLGAATATFLLKLPSLREEPRHPQI